MFLAGKAAYPGIVFLLLTTWVSGPRPTPPTLEAAPSKEVPDASHTNDVNRIQQTLLEKGHYRGKVDGVFGLRTRASIRAYQKAENLPVTGQLDKQTAGKLRVRPEVRGDSNTETAGGKPSAGIKWVKGSVRSGKTRPKVVKTDSYTEGSRGERGKKLQAEAENALQ